MSWTFVDIIDGENGRWSVERKGQNRTLRAKALPIGTPTSVGFLLVLARAHFPPTYDGLWLKDIDADAAQDGTYMVSANYVPLPPREVNWSSYRLTSGGDTVNVKQSLKTIAKYTREGADPDVESDPDAGVLGWDGETAQGIDVPAPGLIWVETHILPQDLVTRSYLGMLTQRKGYVNEEAWKGFQAGEVMFDGIEATAEVTDAESDQYTWTLVFTFRARPNETDIKIGDITVPRKQGWDRIEIRYNKAATDGRIAPKPYAVYVERVFPRCDFKDFGIGE